jgi:hypothetical protein
LGRHVARELSGVRQPARWRRGRGTGGGSRFGSEELLLLIDRAGIDADPPGVREAQPRRERPGSRRVATGRRREALREQCIRVSLSSTQEAAARAFNDAASTYAALNERIGELLRQLDDDDQSRMNIDRNPLWRQIVVRRKFASARVEFVLTNS